MNNKLATFIHGTVQKKLKNKTEENKSEAIPVSKVPERGGMGNYESRGEENTIIRDEITNKNPEIGYLE